MELKLKWKFTDQTISFSLSKHSTGYLQYLWKKLPDMCVVQFIDSMTVTNVHKTTILKLTDLSSYLFFKLLIQCQR